MAQIRESQFAVINISDIDIDLIDLANTGLVTLEKEHEFYHEELYSEIRDLEEGDIIEAQIQGEDVLQANAIWRFLEFDIIGNDPGWIMD